MGDQRFTRFMEAFNEDAPTSIRLNPRNLIPHSSFLIPRQRVPWCSEGFYLEGRPQFTFDPLFHAGCYYVQEAASMFITHIIQELNNLIPHSSFLEMSLTSALPLVASPPPCEQYCLREASS